MRRRVSPGYIHDNKANLLFRYELSVSGLKRFDEEFQHYLQDVGLQIDVGRAFKELPWENLLPTGCRSTSVQPPMRLPGYSCS